MSYPNFEEEILSSIEKKEVLSLFSSETLHQLPFRSDCTEPIAIESSGETPLSANGFEEWVTAHDIKLPLLVHTPSGVVMGNGTRAVEARSQISSWIPNCSFFSISLLQLTNLRASALRQCLKLRLYKEISQLFFYPLSSMIEGFDVVFFDDLNLLREFSKSEIFLSSIDRPFLGKWQMSPLIEQLRDTSHSQVLFSDEPQVYCENLSDSATPLHIALGKAKYYSEGKSTNKVARRGSRSTSIPTTTIKQSNPHRIIPLVDLDLEPVPSYIKYFQNENDFVTPGSNKLNLLLHNFEIDSPVSDHLVRYIKTFGALIIKCTITSTLTESHFKPSAQGAYLIPLCVLRLRTHSNSIWCRSAFKGFMHPGLYSDVHFSQNVRKALDSPDPAFNLISQGLVDNVSLVQFIVQRFPVHMRWTGERPLQLAPHWYTCKYSSLNLNSTLRQVAYRYCGEENGIAHSHDFYPFNDYAKRVRCLNTLLKKQIKLEGTWKSEGPWRSEEFDFLDFLKIPKSLGEFSSTIRQGAEDFFKKEMRLVLGQIAGATQIYAACDNTTGLAATCAVALREIADWHYSDRPIHLYHFFLNAICAVISIIQRIVLWLYPTAKEIFTSSNPGISSENYSSEGPDDAGFFEGIKDSFVGFSKEASSIRIISVFKRAVIDSATIFDAMVFGIQYFFEWMSFFFTGEESKFVSVTRRIDEFLERTDSLQLSNSHDYLWAYRIHYCEQVYTKLCTEVTQIPILNKRKYTVLMEAGKFLKLHSARARAILTSSVTPLPPHGIGIEGPPGTGKSYFMKQYMKEFLSAYHTTNYSDIEFSRFYWPYDLDGQFHNGATPSMEAVLFDDAMQYALNGHEENLHAWKDLHVLGSGLDFPIRAADLPDKNKTAKVAIVGYCTNIQQKTFRAKAGASVDTITRRYPHKYVVVDKIKGSIEKLEKLSLDRTPEGLERYKKLLYTGIEFAELDLEYELTGKKFSHKDLLLQAKKAGWKRLLTKVEGGLKEIGTVSISEDDLRSEELFDELFSSYIEEDDVTSSARLALNLRSVVPDSETSLQTLLSVFDEKAEVVSNAITRKIDDLKSKISGITERINRDEEPTPEPDTEMISLVPSLVPYKSEGAGQSGEKPPDEDEEEYFTSLDLFKHFDTTGQIVKGLVEALLVGLAAMGLKVGMGKLFLPKEAFNSESPSRRPKKKPTTVKATSNGFAFGSEGVDPYSRTRRGVVPISNVDTGEQATIFFVQPAIGLMVLHDFERVYGKVGKLRVDYNVVVSYRPRKCDYLIFQHDGNNLDMVMLHVPEVVSCDRVKSLPTIEHWAHGFKSGVLLSNEPARPDLDVVDISRKVSAEMVERKGVLYQYCGAATYLPDSRTYPGDCGRIMVSSCKNKYTYPIGIHIAGNGERGMLMPFVKEHVQQGIDLLRKRLEEVETPLPDLPAAEARVNGYVSEGSHSHLFPDGPFVDLGVIKNEFRMHSQGKTKLAPSGINLQTSTMGVPVLSSKDGSHLDYVSGKFLQKRSYSLDFDSLRAVASARVRFYPRASKLIPEVIPIREVILGIPETKFVGIELSTSPGFEYNIVKRIQNLVQKGKRDFVSIEPEYEVAQLVLDDVGAQLANLENGESVSCVYFGAEKDERLPLSDIEKGKVRLIMVGSLSYLIIFRMHFGAFCEAVTRCHSYEEFTSTIGISPFHTGEFSHLFHALDEFSNYVMEIDVRGWDKGFPVELHWAFIMCANLWYRKHYSSSAESCEKRTRVYNGTMCGAVAIGSAMLFMARGVFSGGPATTVVNTVGHDVGAHLTFHDLCLKRRLDIPVETQQELLLCKCFGDDGLYATKIPEFTQKDFASVFLDRFGMEATPAGDKSSEFSDFMPIREATFLKRSFELVDGEIRGCLKKSVILEMCQWYRTSTSPDPEIAVRQIVDSAIREAFLWGEEFFSEFSLNVNKELARLGYSSVNHSYSNLLAAFRSDEGIASPIY